MIEGLYSVRENLAGIWGIHCFKVLILSNICSFKKVCQVKAESWLQISF